MTGRTDFRFPQRRGPTEEGRKDGVEVGASRTLGCVWKGETLWAPRGRAGARHQALQAWAPTREGQIPATFGFENQAGQSTPGTLKASRLHAGGAGLEEAEFPSLRPPQTAPLRCDTEATVCATPGPAGGRLTLQSQSMCGGVGVFGRLLQEPKGWFPSPAPSPDDTDTSWNQYSTTLSTQRAAGR